jgi:hypothetical protein
MHDAFICRLTGLTVFDNGDNLALSCASTEGDEDDR